MKWCNDYVCNIDPGGFRASSEWLAFVKTQFIRSQKSIFEKSVKKGGGGASLKQIKPFFY